MQGIGGGLKSSEAGLVTRSIRASVIVTALVALYALFLASPAWALAYAVCALWNTVNVYLWHKLLRAFLVDRRKTAALIFAVIKIPLLYAIGALFIKFLSLPFGAFLAGFNTIFIVMALKIFGREYVAGLARGRSVIHQRES
jgi:hypothetical protein